MSQSWSITINPGPGGARFDPDTYGAKPGAPLQAGNGDQVCWNNQTTQEHQPWPASPSFEPLLGAQPLVAPIASNKSSDGYIISAASGTKVYYVCRFHNSEQGIIEVVS